jgi:hypothetical protein
MSCNCWLIAFGQIPKSLLIHKFSSPQYVIGDSAFTNSIIMVTSYKWALGQAVLPSGQSWFNDVLNVPRTGVENTIGIWKGCFP